MELKRIDGAFSVCKVEDYSMVEYLAELARQAGYGQIELEVVADNDSARALYAKCGFTELGKYDRGMKYDDGSYRDLIVMGKRLS